MEFQVKGWRDHDSAFRAVIIAEGTKRLHILCIESPLRIYTTDKAEARHLTRLTYRGQDYPLRRACAKFTEAGRLLGTTKAATRLIKMARESLHGSERYYVEK